MKSRKINTDLLRDANIPDKFWPLGADDYYGDAAAFERITNYIHKFSEAQSKGLGLLLRGGVGSGKTFLAAFVLKNLLLKGASVSYYSMDELFEAYVSGETVGSNFLSRFKGIHCVAIDNVGPVEKDRATAKRNALERALTYRSDNGFPYIVCTTLDSNQIEDIYGKKISTLINSDLVTVECVVSPEQAHAKNSQRKMGF